MSSENVQFVTGKNYHLGEQVDFKDGFISVWGKHPAGVLQNPMAMVEE